MIENRPWVTILAHATLILGVALVAFPVWITFVAATHEQARLAQVPLPLLPGDQFLTNLYATFFQGVGNAREQSVGLMLFNSMIMALGIALGKIVISMLSAFAIVYFRFPFRMMFFWMIFFTLMLPVEVRILPTFEVVANLGMLDSYAEPNAPLIASATAPVGSPPPSGDRQFQ